MKNKFIRSLTISLFIVLGVVGSVGSRAAEMGAPPDAAQKVKKSDRAPFQGKVHAVDKAAMTITLEGKERKRTIHVTAQTRITKAGKPASLEDAVAGEEIAGQMIRTTEGQEEAVSLRLGPKPKAETNQKGSRKDMTQDKR